MNIPTEPEKSILDKPEGDVKSFLVAILVTTVSFISIFVIQVTISRPKINVLVSGNKSLALSALILLGIFISIESVSRFWPNAKKLVPAARRIGGIGFVFALFHTATVMFVLTNKFPKEWINEQSLSINLAKVAVVILTLIFIGFTKSISKKLGEKKYLYIQVLGYIGLILVLAHVFFLINPSYTDVTGTVLTAVNQTETLFISIFLITFTLIHIFLYFVSKYLSLRIKVVAHTLLYFTVNALIIGSYLSISDNKRHHEEVFRTNRHTVDYIKEAEQDEGIESLYQVGDSLSETSGKELTVFFLNSEKRISHHPEKKEEDKTYQNLSDANKTKDGYGWEVQYSKEKNLFLDTVVSLSPEGKYLVVSTDYTKQSIALNRQIIYSSILALVAIFLTVMSTLFFIRRNVLDPIKKIADASRKMSDGNFNIRVKVKNNDEFYTLAEIFNTLSQRMQEQINDLVKMDKLKNEFIAIASHNLRTPLTTLRGYLDMLGSGMSGKLNAKQKDTLQKAERSATTLSSLTEGLVNITSLEKEGVKIEKDTVNLTAIIEKILKETSVQAKAKEIKIKNNLGKKDITTIGDEAKLRQAFLAVLENAIKFNEKGGEVTIEKIEDDSKQQTIGRKEVIITIKDTGIGIAKNEKENVFQKFNRGTSTYTYEYEGVGLGLYIAKLIIQAHHGRIWFESSEGEGTTFYISLTTTEQNAQKEK